MSIQEFIEFFQKLQESNTWTRHSNIFILNKNKINKKKEETKIRRTPKPLPYFK